MNAGLLDYPVLMAVRASCFRETMSAMGGGCMAMHFGFEKSPLSLDTTLNIVDPILIYVPRFLCWNMMET